MKARFIYFLLMISLATVSCNKEILEPYNNSFIHIMLDDLSSVSVPSNMNTVKTYSVYLSSAPLKENLVVEFEIIIGDGLTEGLDYEIVTKGNTLTFLPGIYDMPIRIKWIPNAIDPSKDNSVRIRLISNSLNITMGLPGPDQLQKEFVITKTR